MIRGIGRFSNSSLSRQDSLNSSNSTSNLHLFVQPDSSGGNEGIPLSRRIVSAINDSIDCGEQQVNRDVFCLNAMVAHLNDISQDFNGCVSFIKQIIDADGKSILLDLLVRSPLMDDKSGSIQLFSNEAYHVILFFNLLYFLREEAESPDATEVIKYFFSAMKGKGILDSRLFMEFLNNCLCDYNKQKTMDVTSAELDLFDLNLLVANDIYDGMLYLQPKVRKRLFHTKQLNEMVRQLNDVYKNFRGRVLYIRLHLDHDGESILLDLLERSPLMDDKSGSNHFLCNEAYHVVLFFHLLSLLRKNPDSIDAIKDFFSDVKERGILDSRLFMEFVDNDVCDEKKRKTMRVTDGDIDLFCRNLMNAGSAYGSFLRTKSRVVKRLCSTESSGVEKLVDQWKLVDQCLEIVSVPLYRMFCVPYLYFSYFM